MVSGIRKSQASSHRTTPRGDEELIRDCLAGDERAWNQLVDRYSRLVYSVPRRYGLSDSDSADVVQNVYLAAFRKLENLKDHGRLSAWLITMAHRESWRVGRKNTPTTELADAMPDISSPSGEDVDRWERQHLVRRGLEELGGRCETLLTILFLEANQPSYEEIARQLDLPVGSIGPTRARCFQKLEGILTRLGL